MSDAPKGFLSEADIRPLLNKDIVICDYDESNLTDIGYNLTPTEFVFSINKGLFMPIHHLDNQRFCWVEPNDTVLILTREAIWVSEKISGTFHSKVKIVSQGFGHISTTLDAYWEGPLLISLNNPTKKKLKFLIGEDKGNGFKHSSFVTLIFYRMATPTEKGHDNLPCRMDILKDIVKRPWQYAFFSKYRKLEDVIEMIRNFESLSVGIGQVKDEERGKRILLFKEKYSKFSDQIEFHIRQAHTINHDILQFEQVGRYGYNIALTVLLCVTLYWWLPMSTDKNTSTTGVSSIVSALVTLYLFFFKKKGDN